MIGAFPDARGHFGAYGGRFVAETLMEPLEELRSAWERYRADPAF
ncbi:MAG: tryptophan synthase subunit beta, partial [Gammaproteobacteria bacterium]|nr:tryptophan synthase subunit beta [Gammaproteobacteria bacterium]